VVAVCVAVAALAAGGCSDGGADDEPAAAAPDRADPDLAEPEEPEPDVADVVVRREDLPEPPRWAPLSFDESRSGDGFDRCIYSVVDGLAGEVVADARAAFLAVAESDTAGTYAVATTSERAARAGVRAAEEAVLPCLARALLEPELQQPGVATEVQDTVDAPVGSYDAEVLARTIPLRMTAPGRRLDLRFDVFAVHRGRTFVLLVFFTDGQLTPREEDDALAAVAGRLGVERLRPLG
jgi:hypothetical protein